MTPRARSVLRAALLGGAFAAAASGCGQTGPLVLPESARPIEPPETPAEARPQDDERENEP